MRTRIILFIFVCVICCNVFAQKVSIKGRVKSANDGMPVSEVNIGVKETNFGTSTDKNGFYELKNVKLPATLVFSHIAYNKLERTVNDVNNGNSAITMNVNLQERVTMLDEFSINASPVQRLERLVYDFEIVDGYLYLTCNKNDDNTLYVYDERGKLLNSVAAPSSHRYFSWDFANGGYLCLISKWRTDYYRITDNKTLSYAAFDTLEKSINSVVKQANTIYVSDAEVDTFHSWCEEMYRLGFRFLGTGNMELINPTHHLLRYGTAFKRLNANCFIVQYNNNVKLGDVFMLYVDGQKDLKLERIFYQQCGYDWCKAINDKSELKKTSAKILEQFEYTLAGLESGRESESSFVIMNSGVTNRYSREHLLIFFGTDSTLHIINGKNESVLATKTDIRMFKSQYLSDIQLQDSNYCWVRFNFKLNELCKLDLHSGEIVQKIKLLRPNAEKVRVWNDKIYFTCPVSENVYNGSDRQLFVQDMYIRSNTKR